MGIASLVLGIVSCLLFPISLSLSLMTEVGIFGISIDLVMGIIGSVLGFVGLKKKAKLATAGLVVSLIPTIILLLLLVLLLFLLSNKTY